MSYNSGLIPGGGGGTGQDGEGGTDGITPRIGENGNWFIGATDTGVHAQGPAGLDGAASTTSGRISDLRNIATRGFQTAAGSLSGGTVTGGNYRSRHILCTRAGTVRLWFPNFSRPNGVNDITVTASVERSDGKRVQVRFADGATKVVIPPNGLVSGTAPVYQPAGTTIYVRTFVEARDAAGNLIDGGKWPRMSAPPFWVSGQNGERAQESVGETDLTLGTGGPSGTTGLMYMPCKITADSPVDPITSIAILGDSISVGSNDRPDSGMFARAINDAYPYMFLGQIGELGAYFQQIQQAPNRWLIAAGATHFWCEYGVNDINATGGNESAATIKAWMIAMWRQAAASGAKVRQTTITPHAQSSDGWATLANQTPDANDAARREVNAWLRDGAPITAGGNAAVSGSTVAGTLRGGAPGHPLYADVTTPGDQGVDDTATALESAVEPGKWDPAIPPSDAFHPTGAGHAAMAARLNMKWLAA